MKTQTNRILTLACATLFACIGIQRASATASISTLASASISADNTGGSYSTLTGPVLDEGANRDIGNAGSSTIILNAPSGFIFDTTATVTATVSRLAGAGTLLTLSSGTATVASGTLTITVSARDQGDGSTRSRITWSGIRVRPSAGTPLASGNITSSGTANIAGVSGSTSFGTLTETPGAASRLAFTTQPGGAVYKTAFTTQPVVRARDQFNNNTTNGLASSLNLTLTLSTGIGSLTGATTLDIGTTAGNGTATFSGLQIDRVENGDVIAAAASGLTSTNSSAFNVTTRTVTVSGITGNNKVYDRTTAATLNTGAAVLNNTAPGDDVSLNAGAATGVFSSSAVGNGKTITISGMALSGTASSNYTLTQPTTTANITAAPVTISGATASNKTYNGNTAATVSTSGATLSGVISGDTVTISGSATGTFSDKNVGTGKSVIFSGVTLSGAQGGNYSLSAQPTATANITPATLTITATAPDRVYDGTTNSTVTLTDNRVSGDSVTVTNSQAFFASKTVANNKTVTAIGFGISGGTDGGNYVLGNTSDTDTANITAKALTISGVTANDKVYDRTTAATLNVVGNALVGVASGDSVTLNTGSATGTFSSSSVGSSKTVTMANFSITGTDAANYSLTQPTDIANITAKSLTVSGGSATSKTYNGNTAVTVSASGMALVGVVSGDTISVTLNTGGIAGTFADKHVGTSKPVQISGLTISGSASANYSLTQPTLTASITARALTITAIANTKIYDGTTSSSATPTVGSGTVQSGDTAAFIETFNNKNVGIAKTLTPSGVVTDGNSGANYTYTYVNSSAGVISTRAITVTAATDSKIYDGNNSSTATPTITTGAIQSGDTASFIQVFNNKNVGSGKTLTPSGSVNDGNSGANYVITLANNTTGSITVRSLAVSAAAANKVYDGNTTASVVLSDNRVSGDVVTVSHTSADFADVNVGAGKLVTVSGISLSGTDAANYSANTFATTNADITSVGLTITGLSVDNKVYDGNDTATLNTAGASLGGVVNPDVVTLDFSGASATFANKNVGNGKPVSHSGIIITGANAANYTLTQPSGLIANITPALLTATVIADNKVYDGTAAATLSTNWLAGVIGLDDVTSLGGTASFADKHAGVGKAVSVIGMTLNGGDAANYQLSAQPGATADITVRDITVSATAASKVYDGNNSAPSTPAISSGSLAGGDIATLTESFDNKNVGSGKTVTPAGSVNDGNNGANYNVTFANNSGGEITVRALAISATAQDKVYDRTTTAIVTLSDDHISGDDIAASHTSASFTDANVGSGKTVNVNGISISGADAANYSANSSALAIANINAASLTASATVSNKAYDGTTVATIASRSLIGAIIPDDVTISGGSASFADKNVGSGKAVSITGLILGGADSANYAFASGSVNTTADIIERALTMTATGVNKAYDRTNTASVTFTDDRINGDVLTTGFTNAEFASINIGTNITISVSGITISGGDAGNYSLASDTATTAADITQRPLTVSATAQNKVYDGNADATVSLSDDHIAGEDVTVTFATASFDNKNVGAAKPVTVSGISMSGADSGNYELASTTANSSADITSVALTASATVNNKIYDGNNSATIASRSLTGALGFDDVTLSGGSASFSDKDAGNGKAVSVTGMVLAGADAANYSLASGDANTTADIAARALIVSASASNKVYDGNANALVALADDRVGGDALIISHTSASFDNKNVGTAKPVSVSGISMTGTDAGNYNLANTSASGSANISAHSLTIFAVAQNKVYDGNADATVALSDNHVVGDDIMISHTSASFDNKNVGTSKSVSIAGITMSGADSGNYELASTAANSSANITPASLTGSITANNKVYDGNNTATIATRSLTGVIGSDDVSLSDGTATFPDKNIGNGKTVSAAGLSLSGSDIANYSLVSTSANTTADITPRSLVVSVATANKVYDGNADATVTFSDDRISGDLLTVSHTAASFDNKNAGTAKPVNIDGVSMTGTDSGNYSLANNTATSSADITVRPLTVSAVASNKAYDGNADATVVLSDDRISGDVLTTSHTSASFDDRNVGTAKPVSIVGISTIGTDAGNYSLANTTALGSADITARSLTVSAVASNKVYDGNADATVTLSDDRISGDVLTISHTSASFENKNAGVAKPVSVSGISMTGTDAGNYNLVSTTASGSADITARSLAVSAIASNKIYDGNANATVTLSDDHISGDVLTIGHTSASFDNKNVGTAKPVSVSGISTTGTDAGNYNLANTSASSSADITAVVLTASATANNKIYDGNTLVTIASRSMSGVIGADDVSLSGGSASFADKNVGNGKPVSVTGMVLGGADMANYSLASGDANTTADITATSLTVTADDKSRTYAAANPTLTSTITGLVPGDNITANYTTTADANSSVGNYPITPTLNDPDLNLGNYNVTTSNGTLTVTKVTLTVTANDATRSVGLPNQVFTASYSGFLNSDNASVLSGSPDISTLANDSSPVGTYPIVISGGTLSAANYNFNFVNGSLTVTPVDYIFFDGFTRATDPGDLSPWQTHSGLWTVTGGELRGGPNTDHTYGNAYIPTNWGNYSVQARLSIPADGYGVGLGGRLDSSSGAHYAAWVYPEASLAGPNMLRLIKFSNWSTWTLLAETNLASVGTIAHAVKLTMNGSQISVDFDGTNMLAVTDSTLTSGGITADMWTDVTSYAMAVDDVMVVPFAANQTITFDPLANKTYGDATFGVSATASSGLPVSFSIVSGPATISGTNITLTGAGGVTVRASQAGNISYNPAPGVDQSFNVGQITVTGSITANNKVYDGNNSATILARSLSGVIGSDDVSLTGGVATFDDKNAGNAKPVSATGLSLGGAQAGSYILASSTASASADITAASLTGSITANNKVYDGNNSATIATRLLSGVIGSDDVSLSGGTAAFTDKNVGAGKAVSSSGLSLSGTDAANYTLASSGANTTADITERSLTVSAAASGKIYDGNANASAALSDDRIGGDLLTVNHTSALFDNKNVGTAKPVNVSGISISGTDAGNYSLATTSASSSADITTASLTGSITADNKVYDGNNSATIASRSLAGVIGADDVTLIGGTATFADKNAGNSKAVSATGLSLSGANAGNYALASSSAVTTADITAAPLTVSAAADNKVYDGNNSATIGSRALTGVIGADDVTVSGGSAIFDTKNAGTGKPVAVTGMVLGGADMANYNLLSGDANTTADITARLLTVSAKASSKVYDGTAVATVMLSDDRISGDIVTTSETSASFDNKNVGASKPVSVLGISISGTDAGNYSLASTSASSSADITAMSLTAAATANNKVYDGDNSATIATRSLSGVIGSEDVTLSGGAATFDNKNVGNGKAVAVVGMILGGADISNYSLASGDATTTADITARSLTVTATAQSKVYDGNTNAVVSLSDNRISGDLLTVANGDQGFDDANVGSGRNVNIVGISISGADAGNYSLVNTTIVAGADITPVQLTVTADNKSRAYAAANPALTATFTGFVNSENSSVISGSADLNTAAETNSPVGAYPITAAIGSLSAANYTFRFVDGTLTITSYALTVTADDKNKVYGAANPALTGSIAGLQNGDNISANYATVADASSAVGSYPITVSLNDPDGKLGNYSVTTNEGTLSVSAALLTVTADDKNKVYGTANPAFTATLTGFVNGEDASVISGSADLATTATDSSPVGSHAITAAIGTLSAANYSFSFANGTLTITPASLTASATVANKVYDGNNIAMIVTRSLTGVIGSDDVSLSGGTATFANKNVGTAKPVTVVGMILGGADIANYSLANVSASSSADITARSLTVTATADNKVYDGNTNAIVHLADNRISGDVLTAENSDQGFDDANVGTAKNVNVLGISISGTDAGNYSLANTSAVATADITPVQLTVTADHKSKAYGSANPALTATFTGFVNSENSSVISGSADLSTAAETNSPVGTYPITAAIGSLSAMNYMFSFVDGTLTVTPYALTVSADNKARTYGATNPALTGSISGLQNGDNISANYATVADTNSAVGGYPITVSLSDPDTKLGNYSVTTNEGTLTVSTALLTVTADDKTKVYGAVNPTLTSTITGYLNGENASILTGSPAISTLADASSPVGNHVITAAFGTLSAANYAFNFVDGSLAITAASLAPNITAASKVYDGNTSAAIVTRSLSGVVGSDDVSLIGGTAIFSDKNVGVGKSVFATGLSLSGGAAGNYTLTSTTVNTTADITVAPITVNGTAQNKIYDGTTAATIASISLAGVIAPDDVTIATAFANFEDKNVGSGKMVSITGLTLGGADMGNYELTSGDVTASADIMHAALSGSITANSKVYDGNTSAVIATRSLDNVIGLDDVNLVGGVASFQDKNVGNGKTVAATGLTLSGADAGNYSLASANAATSADITAAPLTASATAQNKVYDGNNTATIATRSLGGVIGGDDVTISGGSASFDNKNVGTGKPVNVTSMVLGGADMGNYSLASGSANTTANITPVTLTVTADDASRNYGAANPSFTGTLAGVIGGDNITASYITIATPASPAGVYAITPSLNDPDGNLGNYTVTMNNGTLTIVGLAPSNIGSIEKQADGNMHIVVTGTPGQVYHLQAIGDLSSFTWSNISTNTANGSGVVEFDDLGATNHTSRFYRISTP